MTAASAKEAPFFKNRLVPAPIAAPPFFLYVYVPDMQKITCAPKRKKELLGTQLLQGFKMQSFLYSYGHPAHFLGIFLLGKDGDRAVGGIHKNGIPRLDAGGCTLGVHNRGKAVFARDHRPV